MTTRMTTERTTTETPPAEPAEPVRSQEGALAEQSILSTLGLIAGVVGLTALVFSVVLYALDPGVLPLSVANGLLGVAGITAYIITHRAGVSRALGGRSTPLVLLEIASVAGSIGAFAVVNYLVAQEPKEWDLTRDRLYTLQEESVRVATQLKKNVTIYGFYRSSEPTREILRQSIALYRQHSDRIRLKMVNPDAADPQLADRFDMNPRSPRIVVAGEDGRFKKIGLPTEESLTNALAAVSERPARTVYFLTGHGEAPLDSPTVPEGYALAASALRNEGYTIKTTSLLDRENVPADASLTILAGAKMSLFPHEADALKAHLYRGGRVLLLLEPGVPHGLGHTFKSFGVEVGEDIVLEPNPTGRAQGFGLESPLIQSYEPHPITRTLNSAATLFFRARSVQPRVGMAQIKSNTLFSTSPTSWGETQLAGNAKPVRDEGDVPGPVPLAVAVTRKTATAPNRINNEARMVVFGDHHFANNRFLPMGANGDLFRNAANWVIGEEERITLRPKRRSGDHLPLTQVETYGIIFFSVNLLPLLIVGFGFSVWAIRRRK